MNRNGQKEGRSEQPKRAAPSTRPCSWNERHQKPRSGRFRKGDRHVGERIPIAASSASSSGGAVEALQKPPTAHDSLHWYFKSNPGYPGIPPEYRPHGINQCGQLSSRASRVSYASSARREEACCASPGHGEAPNTGMLDHGILSDARCRWDVVHALLWLDLLPFSPTLRSASSRLRLDSQEDVVSCFGGGSPMDSQNSAFCR